MVTRTLDRVSAFREQQRGQRAYVWTAGVIGAVWFGLTVWGGSLWFSLGMDLTAAIAWFIVFQMIAVPLTLVVVMAAWGILALLRRAGGSRWPSFLQGLLASTPVLVLCYVGLLLLFAEYE